jgi:hypothetical protein
VDAPQPISVLATVYATDEDLFIRAVGDWATLAPAANALASAADGVFSIADPWTLISSSTNFAAAGVKPQHIVQLTAPRTIYKGVGDFLVVDSVDVNSVVLRRVRNVSRTGFAPGPANGVTGVVFYISSLDPQIEQESYTLNQRYAIDPSTPGRAPSDAKDLRVLRDACVFATLQKRYLFESRDDVGDFAIKARLLAQELGDVEARLNLRWNSAVIGQDQTNMFFTRVER